MKGDLDSKTISLRFDYVSTSALEGKELLMLVNSKTIVYPEDTNDALEFNKTPIKPEIKPYTNMHWLPLSTASPLLTTFTFARERVYEAQSEIDRIMGKPLAYEDFLSVRDDLMEQRPYTLTKTNTRAAAAVDFQLSHHLFIESPRLSQSMLTAFELAGGVYVLLTAVVGFCFSSCVPYFLHLHIIRNLFKVDNNPGGKPQS